MICRQTLAILNARPMLTQAGDTLAVNGFRLNHPLNRRLNNGAHRHL
jgi:hypothetical protein